jgi:hypothetical protein
LVRVVAPVVEHGHDDAPGSLDLVSIFEVGLIAVDGFEEERGVGLEGNRLELFLVVEVEQRGLEVKPCPGTLPSKRRLMPSSGCTLTTSWLWRGRARGRCRGCGKGAGRV